VTHEQWEEEQDRELDARLTALFRSAPPPQPPSGFLRRTLEAIRRQPLPAGRRPLRQPWSVPLGWAALVAGTAATAWLIIVNQPLIAAMFASLLSRGVSVGVWALQLAGTAMPLLDVFTTTGLAVARVVATKEGSAGLMLIGATGALSLSLLHRLLFSEREASRWQELS
jgi:hypothetical protein